MNEKNVAKKLLQCAIEAGADVKAPVVGDDSDRQWLNNAVTNIASAHTNLVERLKECLQILQAFEIDSEITVDDVEVTLEEIAELSEDIDVACDFYKVGGFPIIIKILSHSEYKLRLGAAEVIGVVAQNNKYCQDILLQEYHILNSLLDMSMQIDSDSNQLIAVKAMYAISCLIRQNNIGIDLFLKNDGFSYLLKGIQSKVTKLKLKSIFLLRSLCKENHEIHQAINSDDFVKVLINALTADDNLDIVEFALDILITVICHHVAFRDKCKLKSTEFKAAISNLLHNSTIQKDHFEILQYCEQLKKVLNLKN